MSGYSVPAKPVEVEEVIKGSRFISRAINVDTVEAAKGYLKQLREAEPDATHHCWAYIVGDPKSTTLIGCSDDGEPAGTAGKPMLNILQHSGIGDIIVVCTRYYGGTKLGTGGLARAYGGGVKLVMEQIEVTDKIDKAWLKIVGAYECAKDIEYELKLVDAEIINTEYDAQVTYQVALPAENKTTLTEQLIVRFGEKVQWKSIQS
ncbi:YigZ family protein [Pleionea sediminis]|uniref:YigZ family protein n=1 Tax=Pleionea sediminis TaxID=2569479 RepID=UPI001FEC0B50|nr:YigZ family protein [Pleionea sediminis]